MPDDYFISNLNQFNINNLPNLMNKTQDELINMVQIPLQETDHRFVSEMIDIQSCQIQDQHQHTYSEQDKYAILVEPVCRLLDIIDI